MVGYEVLLKLFPFALLCTGGALIGRGIWEIIDNRWGWLWILSGYGCLWVGVAALLAIYGAA